MVHGSRDYKQDDLRLPAQLLLCAAQLHQHCLQERGEQISIGRGRIGTNCKISDLWQRNTKFTPEDVGELQKLGVAWGVVNYPAQPRPAPVSPGGIPALTWCARCPPGKIPASSQFD